MSNYTPENAAILSKKLCKRVVKIMQNVAVNGRLFLKVYSDDVKLFQTERHFNMYYESISHRTVCLSRKLSGNAKN